jgi:hypothetical protein
LLEFLELEGDVVIANCDAWLLGVSGILCKRSLS